MKKIILLGTAMLTLSGGGLLWAASSVPADLSQANWVQKLGYHICGERFCGYHGHHHCHTWCDRKGRHWHCEGHD